MAGMRAGASGRFLLRIPPGLHASLRGAAAAAGLSLNDFCARKLAAPGDVRGDGISLVLFAAEHFGDDLRGVILFGSFARGEAIRGSDADVLVLLADSVPLRRGLYRPWDSVPLSLSGHRVEAHFAHLPPPDRIVGGLWAEVALDGVVLFARDPEVTERLARVRGDIAAGRVARRMVHGQPYWVEAV